MKNYRRPEPEVRVKATVEPKPAVKISTNALPQFPDYMEDHPEYIDYTRSGHARPTAWVRFGRLEIRDQNLTPSHAAELSVWVKSMVELANKIDSEKH